MDRHHGEARGFTLIEMMGVVAIIGLLMTLVGMSVAGRVGEARRLATSTQVALIEQALEAYQLDNARYPTEQQGLEALVVRPTLEPLPRAYPEGGYIRERGPLEDVWGRPFQYRMPGERNPGYFDVYSLGRDGQPGGEGADADIGNWEPGAGQ